MAGRSTAFSLHKRASRNSCSRCMRSRLPVPSSISFTRVPEPRAAACFGCPLAAEKGAQFKPKTEIDAFPIGPALRVLVNQFLKGVFQRARQGLHDASRLT